MKEDKPREILRFIIGEIKDRGGLDNAWMDIDRDIQNEILEEWLVGIRDILKQTNNNTTKGNYEKLRRN